MEFVLVGVFIINFKLLLKILFMMMELKMFIGVLIMYFVFIIYLVGLMWSFN